MKIVLTQQRLILITALGLIAFYNLTFFKKLLESYAFSGLNSVFICSIFILLVAALVALFSIFSSKYTTKPLLILIIVLSSFASYFMDSYGTIIDDTMLQNIIETDAAEATDLFSVKFLLYVLVLGVIPALAVYRIPVLYQTCQRETLNKIISVSVSLAIVAGILLALSAHYASFIREHKSLRYYTNPLSYMYAVTKTLNVLAPADGALTLQTIGEDAAIPATDGDQKLIILVVGETARADRFSLNGYSKNTNPLLQLEDVISFSEFYSCGTSTAVSVPCMFSFLGQDDYSRAKANSTENVLDVLSRAGVNVLWRDNNSSSKGVADRVRYEDFRKPDTNPVCDSECRDVGMLAGLQAYIDSVDGGDIVIVLHQMGNHGPAYYKRYPKAFEVFTPVCKSNQLERCSTEEINNAYDNVINYTDYFLSQVISLLKNNAADFETGMFYVSDHGESLGENGLYLHGLPYAFAPQEQKNVAALLWFGEGFDVDRTAITQKAGHPFSHDNIPHTLLGLLEVETHIYDKSLDIMAIY